MNGKKAKQLRKLVSGNESAYFHAKKKYNLNKSTNLGDLMRTKEEITAEFSQVKVAKEQFESKAQECAVRISQLQGQFQILEEIEKENAETSKNISELSGDSDDIKKLSKPKESKPLTKKGLQDAKKKVSEAL